MVLIEDHQNNIVAYLLDQMIISIDDKKVIGLILGHCVYNSKSQIIGIYSKNKILDTKGETIAQIKTILQNQGNLLPARKHFIIQGWELIKKITVHVCAPVKEKFQWSKNNFTDVLAS